MLCILNGRLNRQNRSWASREARRHTLLAYAKNKGSGKPAHLRSLAGTIACRSSNPLSYRAGHIFRY